jgi:hypothetical protein
MKRRRQSSILSIKRYPTLILHFLVQGFLRWGFFLMLICLVSLFVFIYYPIYIEYVVALGIANAAFPVLLLILKQCSKVTAVQFRCSLISSMLTEMIFHFSPSIFVAVVVFSTIFSTTRLLESIRTRWSSKKKPTSMLLLCGYHRYSVQFYTRYFQMHHLQGLY